MRRPQTSAMQHYIGLDVSVKETSVCIVDKAGKVIREVKVATEPVAILAVLTEEALAIERIGLEAGPLSQWLYSALAEAGLPVICVETRHMKAAHEGDAIAHLALWHDQLMSERGILCFKPALRLEERDNHVQQEGYQGDHVICAAQTRILKISDQRLARLVAPAAACPL